MRPNPLLLASLLAGVGAPLTAWAVGTPAPAAAPAGPGGFAHTVQPFLKQHCAACHTGAKAAAGLDVERFRTVASLTEHREAWEKVLEKIQTGEMPPKGSPKPSDTDLKAVTGWIQGQLQVADRAAPTDPGRVTARRLNRAEYNNTIRDLLGVDLKPADEFPQDDSGYGFDNIGDVLSLSPVLMERYLTAAERVTRAALFGTPTLKPTMVQFRTPKRKSHGLKKAPSEYDSTGLTLPSAMHATFACPADGEYQLRIATGGERPYGSEVLRVAVWLDGKQVQDLLLNPDGQGAFFVDRQDLNGKAVECRLKLTPGEHWIAASILRAYDGLPPSYGGANPSSRPTKPPNPFEARFRMPPPDATPEQLERFKRFVEQAKERASRPAEVLPIDNFSVNNIEVRGPYNQAKGPSPASLRTIYTCGHLHGGHTATCADRIIGDFTRRAFRRAVTPAEVAPYLRLYQMARKEGDSFDEGICVALQGVLVSPRFLFRLEQDPPAAPHVVTASTAPAVVSHPVNQYELASRLSYFLWSSTPDDELLRVAAAGKLRQPAVLTAQVRRMLRDPKAASLVENFAGQWLELRKLEAVKPDRDRFPDFDTYLKRSIRQETELFFQNVMREDRSVLDFLDGKYTFVNERLAEFYGLPGVKGPEFRKVDLTGTPRGGVLTQASVLTVSSYATRTSPVLRGKWILANLLNSPPPPPPPGVPNLDEAKVGQSASLRQQLEAHRTNPTCASCHGRMDPLGFALENFDAVGAWRTQDGAFKVDSAGSLPDGRTFDGPEALTRVLKSDRQAFTRCLTQKLLTYALGRGLERYDTPTVNKIVDEVAARDYKWSALVLGIVQSQPFQMLRGEKRP